MEEKELLEIEAREREQTKKNLVEMVRRKRIGDVWLLYQDKFTLENKKSCYPIGWVKVPLLIPIHEKVLVGIPPFSSSDEFHHTQGFNIDDIMEWRRRGWVETLLTVPHSEYAGLDYLDQLIQVSPSMGIRTTGHSWMLAGGRDNWLHLCQEGEGLLKGVKPHEEYRRLFGERSERIYHRQAVGIYVSMRAFRLTELVREILNRFGHDQNRVAEMLYFSEAFLIQPLTIGLKQTVVFRSEHREVISQFQKDAMSLSGGISFVPCWLADVYENLGATIPQTMDTDEINAVRKHSVGFVQAMKSLDEEIDKTVRRNFRGGELEIGEEETILAKKEEFRRRWYADVVPTFSDISRAKEMLSIGLTGTIIGSALALSALVNVASVPPAIVPAIAGAKKIKKLVDPAAEFLSTFFECNPIHLGFYRVHKELRRLKDSS